MILGFNEYMNELLLEARSPEEVVRILSYKYQNIPESLIKDLVDADPTKKKSYAAWVLEVEKNPRTILNYLNSGRLEEIFMYFRENAKNGASLVDKKSIAEAERYLPDSSDVLAKSDDEAANDYEIAIETPEWIVATPNTYEASKKLGANTKWCTADAYGNGEYYYKNYTSDGRLWVNFDKRRSETLNGITYPYKRYQFCFERKAFLDALDDPFNFEDIDMPEEVQEFYTERGYDMDDLVKNDEQRWEEYTDARFNDGVYLFEEVYLLRTWNDDFVFDEDDEDADYELYDTNFDQTDSIYNSEYYRNDSVVFKSEEKDFAILKEKYTRGGYSIAICQPLERNGQNVNIYTNISNYKLLVEDGSEYVAFIDPNGDLIYLTDAGEFHVEGGQQDKVFSDDAEIFLNRALSRDGDLYIEVADEGMHSLFRVDYTEYELAEIVMNDIPANGKYFTVNEKGKIVGKYGVYNLNGSDDSNDGGYIPVKNLLLNSAQLTVAVLMSPLPSPFPSR